MQCICCIVSVNMCKHIQFSICPNFFKYYLFLQSANEIILHVFFYYSIYTCLNNLVLPMVLKILKKYQ